MSDILNKGITNVKNLSRYIFGEGAIKKLKSLVFQDKEVIYIFINIV